MTDRTPALAAGEVHVWHFGLGGGVPADAAAKLRAEDWERADRFVFARDRSRFLQARCRMRRLLGAYVGLNPRALRFDIDHHGKPRLDPRLGVAFNLSHSGDQGLLAIVRGAEIGVDIETFEHAAALPELAEVVFTPLELRALAAVGPAGFHGAFLTGWTRKEALLKALGMGLTVEPASVHVGIAEHKARIDGASHTMVEVSSLPADKRFVAAVAVVGGFSAVRHFEGDTP